MAVGYFRLDILNIGSQFRKRVSPGFRQRENENVYDIYSTWNIQRNNNTVFHIANPRK